MTPAGLDQFWPCSARRLLRLALCLALVVPAFAARAIISPGELAPSLTIAAPGGTTATFEPDQLTSPALLLFVKPDDRYSSAVLSVFDSLHRDHPQLIDRMTHTIIVTRLDGADVPPRFVDWTRARRHWTLLLDRNDQAYKAYSIVATPSVVMIDPDATDASGARVHAVHPGYDPSIQQDLRDDLARLLDLQLVPPAPDAPPDMRILMARRLAARGLFERALDYYEQVDRDQPLAPALQLEVIDLLIELERFGEAVLRLDDLASSPALAPLTAPLAEKLRQRQSSPAGNDVPTSPAIAPKAPATERPQ